MSKTIRIGDRCVGDPDGSVFVIAEIGINHDGDEGRARSMIAAATDCGADAVKFQTVDADESYLPGTASHAAFSGHGLPPSAYERLMAQARELGIVMFSTPGDLGSLDAMRRLGMPCIKISSGQLTNVPMLRAAAASGLPLIVSTGMADLATTRRAVDMIKAAGGQDYALLHCTSLYPAPADSLNLRAMATLAREFAAPIGYSDHYLGNEAVLAAVAMGATIIEKHFTLDRRRPGADHALSAEPPQFAAMMHSIREIERMRGSGLKAPTDQEAALARLRWRYLVARRDIEAGEALTPELLVAKRLPDAGAAIEAAVIDRVVGRRLRRALAANAPLTPDLIEDVR